MKVLMINVVCGIRSTGRICTDLADELEKQGNEVKIAYGRERVPYEFQKYAIRIGTGFDTKTHAAMARVHDSCGFGSKLATKRFIKWVNCFNPDIIILHNLHGYYIHIGVLFDYLRSCEKKIIWTLHDCWAFTGHSPYCDVIKCERWKKGCFKCPNKLLYPKSYIDCSNENWKKKKDTFANVRNLTIITPSRWLARQVKESFLKNYKTIVVNNGIDTSKFHPSNSMFKERIGIDGKIMILGVATAWDDMKGLSDYYKLADLLGEKYQVVLVGLTNKQINHLPNNVMGIGRTKDVDELASIYSAADIYVNLSYCENYPTVNLEAMACDTLVVTYNAGGSSETVENRGGIVVEKGNILSVVNAINDMSVSVIYRLTKEEREQIDRHLFLNKYMEVILDNV